MIPPVESLEIPVLVDHLIWAVRRTRLRLRNS